MMRCRISPNTRSPSLSSDSVLLRHARVRSDGPCCPRQTRLCVQPGSIPSCLSWKPQCASQQTTDQLGERQYIAFEPSGLPVKALIWNCCRPFSGRRRFLGRVVERHTSIGRSTGRRPQGTGLRLRASTTTGGVPARACSSCSIPTRIPQRAYPHETGTGSAVWTGEHERPIA